MTKQMTEDEWVQFLWSLHNVVRNSKGIKLTGMAALNEINNFLLIRFAEKKISKFVEDEELPEFCKFSYLYEKYASDEKIKEDTKKKGNESTNAYKLFKKMYYIDGKNGCVMKHLIEHEYFEKYLYTDVIRSSAYFKRPEVGETVQQIINMISKKLENEDIGYEFFDKFGSAYEIFKTDACKDKTTGQHFTPVAVKRFIMDEIKPQYNETLYEPCAGSGGFIHTAFSYVHQHDEEHQKKFKKNIYANECNPEIIKPLMINMLLHDLPVENIHERDSLSNTNCKEYNEKFDIITTNPPFGMSTVINPNVHLEDYWGPLKSGKSVIKDSSGQFIMHIYNSLKDGGRCGFVIDRGILNNGNTGASWQCKLRKFLIENTNMTKIVLLPTGIFTYTNFATAIIFFTKGEKTTEVKIYEGQFTDVKKKEGLMIDEKSMKILKYADIKKSGYSLKIENEKKNAKCSIGYVKLGDITKFYPTTKHCTSIGKEIGKYRFYSSSQKDKLFLDSYEIDNESIIIGNGGSANVHYDIKFTPSKHVTVCNIIDEYSDKIMYRYMYWYLLINLHMLEEGFSGGGLKWLNREKIKDINIQLISIDHQQEIVEFLDKIFAQYDINKLPEIIKDTPIFELLILRRYNDFADAMQLIYRKIEADAMQKKFDDDKKAMFRWMLNGMQCESKKLGEIITHHGTGKSNSTEITDTGEYPFYSASAHNPTGTHNKFDFDGKDYFIFAKSGGNSTKIFGESIGIGKFWRVTGKSSGNVATMKFDVSDKINIDYLDYYLKVVLYDIQKMAKYATGNGNINVPEMLEKIIVKIPDECNTKKLLDKMRVFDNQKSTYQSYADELQTQIDKMMKTIKQLKEDTEFDRLLAHIEEQKRYIESVFESWKK